MDHKELSKSRKNLRRRHSRIFPQQTVRYQWYMMIRSIHICIQNITLKLHIWFRLLMISTFLTDKSYSILNITPFPFPYFGYKYNAFYHAQVCRECDCGHGCFHLYTTGRFHSEGRLDVCRGSLLLIYYPDHYWLWRLCCRWCILLVYCLCLFFYLFTNDINENIFFVYSIITWILVALL